MQKNKYLIPLFTPEYLDPEMLVELCDHNNRLLLHTPWKQAMRQGLACRAITLLLRKDKNSIYLKEVKSQSRAGSSSLSLCTAPLKAGHSHEQCALEISQAETGLTALKAKLLAESLFFKEYNLFISLFEVRMPGKLPPVNKAEEKVFIVDEDELNGLMLSAPELLGPELIWLAGLNLLFSQADSH